MVKTVREMAPEKSYDTRSARLLAIVSILTRHCTPSSFKMMFCSINCRIPNCYNSDGDGDGDGDGDSDGRW